MDKLVKIGALESKPKHSLSQIMDTSVSVQCSFVRIICTCTFEQIMYCGLQRLENFNRAIFIACPAHQFHLLLGEMAKYDTFWSHSTTVHSIFSIYSHVENSSETHLLVMI